MADEYPSITCPVCKMTSYHPKDIEYGYCGNCNNFHDLMLGSVTPKQVTDQAVDYVFAGKGHGLNGREMIGEILKELRVESSDDRR